MSLKVSQSPIAARLLRGAGAQGFCQVVLVLIRLAEVPLFLHFWGPHLYGEWLMLFAIPSYLAVGDGGFCTAACHDMTMRGQTGDRESVLAVFQSTWLLLVIISVAVGACALTFVNTTPLAHWLGFSIIDQWQLRIILLFLTAYVLIGFQYGLLQGGFWISGRYPLSIFLKALTQLLEFAGLGSSIALGCSPVGAAAGFLGGRLLGFFICWACQRRLSPWLRHGISHVSLSEVRRLFAPAMASLAFPLGNALNVQGIRLVVGLALGPSAVAAFATMRTLARLAVQPGNVINRLIEPELSLAFGLKDEVLFRKLFVKSCQGALWGCMAASLVMVPAAYWVYPIWTGGRIQIAWPTFLILLAVTLVNGLWYTSLMAPYATNSHGRVAVYYSAIYGAAVLAVAYVAAAWIGLSGPALALLAAECAMGVVVIHASLNMSGLGLSEFTLALASAPFGALARTGRLLKFRFGAARPNGPR